MMPGDYLLISFNWIGILYLTGFFHKKGESVKRHNIIELPRWVIFIGWLVFSGVCAYQTSQL